jgi:hypothetical protein
MYTKHGNNTFNCLWGKTKITWGLKGIKVFSTKCQLFSFRRKEDIIGLSFHARNKINLAMDKQVI